MTTTTFPRLIAIWVLLCTAMPAFAQTLHLLAFCDTDDSRLMLPASQSYSFFKRELTDRITNNTGMALRTYTYEKAQFTAANLDNALAGMSVGSDDVIIFWYDGHGYNDGSNDWPTLSMPNTSSARSLNSIYNTLKGKGARLTVVMANACNRERTTRANFSAANYLVQNPSADEVAERYRDLFLRSRGTALVSSSKKGESSTSGQFGAWFFLGFRESLDQMMDATYNGTISWDALLNNAMNRTTATAADAGYDQHPIRYCSITTLKRADTAPSGVSSTQPTPTAPKTATTAPSSGSSTKPTDLPTRKTYTANGVGFTIRYIPGGTFSMGSNDGEADEKPIHSVGVSDFWMMETEVTQALYRAVVGSNPSHFSGCDQCPVEQVSWDDAQAFISKLNSLTGASFRLPTEAEWEYAAGGGNGSSYASNGLGTLSSSGTISPLSGGAGVGARTKWAGTSTESSLGSYAWLSSNSDSKTHPVATKSPNGLGLYDMSGNVWEWCSDWYGAYSSGAQTNPTGTSSGSGRVFRGGGWGNGPRYCRVAYRDGYLPTLRSGDLGFRLVRLL